MAYNCIIVETRGAVALIRLNRRSSSTMHAAFALADQKEGMNAFLGKRPPNFTHE